MAGTWCRDHGRMLLSGLFSLTCSPWLTLSVVGLAFSSNKLGLPTSTFNQENAQKSYLQANQMETSLSKEPLGQDMSACVSY